MALSTVKLGETISFGANVYGVTMAALQQAAFRQELNEVFLREGVLVFKEAPQTPEFHLQLAACFGELERFAAKELWVEGYPELIWLTTDPDMEAIYEVDGQIVAGWLPWHTDTVYSPKLPRAALLRSVELPAHGGDTGFMCKIDAYDRLPEAMRRRIEDLEVVYRVVAGAHAHFYPPDLRASMVKSASYSEATIKRVLAQYPAAAHRLVERQPLTGRKLLNYSPMFSMYVQGMAPEESHEVLTALSLHISDERHAYRHRWNGTDYLLWDNWRVNHKAYGCPAAERRAMQRAGITSGRVMGRALSAEQVDLSRVVHEAFPVC